MEPRRLLRPISALMIATLVAVAARYSNRALTIPPQGFLPPSFVTHSAMLVLSVALMWLLSRGRLGVYGFTRGTYRFSPRILLWGLPTAVLSMVALASPDRQPVGALSGLTRPQLILFVWVYASICEELLTRGLLQTLLAVRRRNTIPGRRLSMPVVISGLFFGAMHVVLFESMGPRAVPIIIMVIFLGLVAGRYREKTGSLLPAVIVHMLFNVGGMLPLWIISWLKG